MYKKVLFAAVIIKVVLVFSAWAQTQDNNLEKEAGLMQSSFFKDFPPEQIPYDKDKNIRNYLINFCLRIFDQEENPLVNSSWSRVTRSGQAVFVNLKANNLNIAVLFVPYFLNENTIMLLSKSKVILKYVNYSGGRYYSTVDSIPLKLGEKALFFPLGLLNDKVENISSCVLEIEVLYNED
ncbi:MAG: hypothetical protein FWF38_07825 [Spirochaetaceae bacterium]|nr:hypothetical protein [Spirochaetaceae bacterium]